MRSFVLEQARLYLVIPAQAGIQIIRLKSGFRITTLRNDKMLSFVIPAQAGIQNMCLYSGFRVKHGMTSGKWVLFNNITA